MFDSLNELTYINLPDDTVRVTRLNPITGKPATMDLPITEDELIAFAEDGMRSYIQDLLPMCNADQREFLKTGITPDSWDHIFPKDDKS